MKLLVNGNTVTEMICEKVVKVREFGKKELVKEFDFSIEDMNLVETILNHIKNNKLMYARLVLITALMLHFNMNFIYASELSTSLDTVGNKIVGMLMSFAKWGCMGMGLRNMVITLINGGNMKQAMTEGIQYWIGYLFIEFYPQLFDLFSGIKF
ncbi:hypothetical protein H8697_00805 [[Eubacterium] tenue]|nr:hypothetical protein [[Eubacterium] tenue]MBC8630249.1 hypothetical protein [[Eubacterium] tenue]